MKHRFTVGVAVAIALSLAACAAPPGHVPATTPASPSARQELPTKLLVSDGGKKAIVHSGTSSAPKVAARLTGTLEPDGAGCITVRAKDGDDWTLVFPEGTGFNGESVVLPDNSSLAVGNSVTLAGSRVPANESLSMCLNYARLLSVETASVIP